VLAGWRAWLATRRVALPLGVRVVGVGGDVRGGAGRTPLAIALAQALGPGVVLVGHGYGGSARAPHVVERDDAVERVGDEALVAARALACPVVVGPREGALRLAASLGSVVIVDRLLQTRPVPLACSILATRALAPPGALVRLVDVVGRVGSSDLPERLSLDAPLPSVVGLVTSMARPNRALAALRDQGCSPRIHVARRDHAPFSGLELRRLAGLARDRGLAAWVVDAKTEALLAGRGLGSPVICLRHTLVPSTAWLARVRAFVGDSG